MVPEKVCQKYRWFEETLCQLMSWYAMNRIYESRTDHPLPQLDKFYSQMPDYINDDQRTRAPLAGVPLPTFIQTNLQHLQANCYNRAMNRTIAYELYPLFLKNPGLWKIIPSLHTLTNDMSLSDALNRLCRTLNSKESGSDQLIKWLLK